MWNRIRKIRGINPEIQSIIWLSIAEVSRFNVTLLNALADKLSRNSSAFSRDDFASTRNKVEKQNFSSGNAEVYSRSFYIEKCSGCSAYSP